MGTLGLTDGPLAMYYTKFDFSSPLELLFFEHVLALVDPLILQYTIRLEGYPPRQWYQSRSLGISMEQKSLGQFRKHQQGFGKFGTCQNGYDNFAELEKLTAAQKNKLKESKKKDARALFLIQQAMDELIFSRIMAATISKEAWDLLQEEYQGTSKVISVKLQTLSHDFENLIMKNSESIQDFFSRVSSTLNQIRTYGEKLYDKKIVEKVLRSLPNKFDHIVAVIEESKDLSKYSMNELMGSLQTHEQRLNRTAENSLEQAREQANYHKEKSDEKVEKEDNVFLSCLTTNVELDDEIWYLDSDCRNHMTGNKDYFLEIDETVKPRVRMGDNNRVNAHGIGPIVVSTMVGKKQIQDVMNVPGLAQNLLSLGQLIKKGYRAIFNEGECKLYDKKSMKLVLSIKMKENKMFPLVFSKLVFNVFTASNDDSMLWHRRYGHLNFGGVSLL
ncbi:uncharacterized protein LOC143888980 [Tasmannia lanceolata]|uniref:uncharacterized protein LOC143888980 n=1 Tax=Tasmannia lanceolata TaxID=3420 RepID=UPI004064A291